MNNYKNDNFVGWHERINFHDWINKEKWLFPPTLTPKSWRQTGAKEKTT